MALRPFRPCFIRESRLYWLFSREFSPPGTSCSERCFMIAREEFDPLAPQREAAMFYGLFLRGPSADALRRDIDIPRDILSKWMTSNRFEPQFRDNLRRLYSYRKQVLAIFDELVDNERFRARVH